MASSSASNDMQVPSSNANIHVFANDDEELYRGYHERFELFCDGELVARSRYLSDLPDFDSWFAAGATNMSIKRSLVLDD